MVSKWLMHRLACAYYGCASGNSQGVLQSQDNAIDGEYEGIIKSDSADATKLIELAALITPLPPSLPIPGFFRPLHPPPRPPPPVNLPSPPPRAVIAPKIKHMPLQINHSKGFPNIYKKKSLVGDKGVLTQFVALGFYAFYPVMDGFNIILNSSLYKPKKVTVLKSNKHLEVKTEGIVDRTIVERNFLKERGEWHEYINLYSAGRNTVVPLDINILTDENDNYYTIHNEVGGWKYTLFIPKEKHVFLPIVDGKEIIFECCFYYPHLVRVASKRDFKQIHTYANVEGIIRRRVFERDENKGWSLVSGTGEHVGYRLLTLDVAKDKPQNDNYTVRSDYTSIPSTHTFRASFFFVFGSIVYNGNPLFPPTYYPDKVCFSEGSQIDFKTTIPRTELIISYVMDNDKRWLRLATVETETVRLDRFDISRAFQDNDLGFSQDEEIQDRTANYRAPSGILHHKIYSGDTLVWSSDWRFMVWLKHEYLQSAKMFYMQTISRQGTRRILFFLEDDGTWHKVSGRQYVAMLAKRMEPISFDLDFVGSDNVHVTNGPKANRHHNMVRFRPHAGHYVKEITFMRKRIWSLKSLNDGICFFIRLHKSGERWNCAIYTFTPTGRVVLKRFQRLGNVWRSKSRRLPKTST